MFRSTLVAICLLCFVNPNLAALEHEVSLSGSLWDRPWTWIQELASTLYDDLHEALPDAPRSAHASSSDSGDASNDSTSTGDEPDDDPSDLKGTIISSG